MSTKLLRPVLAAIFIVATNCVFAAIPPAENLLPPDTLVFLSVPDCNALRAASKVSPQLMFWNDPAMKPFHDHVMTSLTQKYIAPLEQDLGIKATDFADLPQGQFTLAATMNGSNGHDDIPPGLILLVDARDKSAQLKTNFATLTKKWTDKGHVVRTEQIRSLPFTVVTLSSNDLSGIFSKNTQTTDAKPVKPVDIYMTQFQSLFIAVNSPKIADVIAAHLTGGSAPALAEDASFASDKPILFREPPTYYGWFNAKLFLTLAANAANAAADPDSLQPRFNVAQMLNATGLNGLKSASFSLHEARDGSSAEFHLSAPQDSRTGVLKILSLPPKDSSPPAFVPDDVVKFSRVRLDGRQAWADLQKVISAVSPQGLAGLNSIIDLANTTAQQKDPSFDLRNYLFANLGDDLVSYSKAPNGSTLAAIARPPGIILLATPKPDEMIQAIKIIGSMLAPQDSTATPRDFHGHKIFSVAMRARRTADGNSLPQPPLLLSSANGYLAISTDEGMMEEFLRNGSTTDKPLRETPSFAANAARVNGMNNGLFSYQNQREVMRTTFKLLKSINETGANTRMMPNPVRDLMDFSLLPDYDSVSKYFYSSFISGGASNDGLWLKVFTPRPPGLN